MDKSCDDPRTKDAEKIESRKLVKKVFLALLAGLLINVFMGLLIDFGELKTAFRETSLIAVLVPFMIVFIIYVIDTLRFKLVFPKFGVRISFRDGLYNNIIGYFFCNITPGTIGGQPFQVLHLSRLGLESTIVSNVVFSRLIEGNIVQLFIVASFFHKGIGMMASLGKGAFLLIAGMLISVVTTVILVLAFLNPHLLGALALRMEHSALGKLIAKITKNPCWAVKISVWSEGLGAGFKVLWRNNMGTMLLDILINMVEQLLWAAALYIPLVIFTGAASPFPEFLLSYILCGLVSLFIPTPGAAGSIEAAYLLVLSTLTGKPAATMSAILIWRFGVYYLHLLVGGLVYFLKPMKRAVYKPGKDGFLSHIRKRRDIGVKPGRPEAGP